MATECIHDKMKIISLSLKEATDLIGLLVAQLAGVPLVGNMSGAVSSTNIVEDGVVKYRLALTLDPGVV